MLSVLLFQFIGFQYSAYIAGEVRGNVRRGVLIALIGALVIGVLANSVYVDAISSHFGFNTQVSWGGSYWGFNTQPVGAAARPAELDAAAGGGREQQPVAAVVPDQPRRGGVPVPAVPGVHQLHQPDAARVEPRPAGARVVRERQRAPPRPAERDHRHARADRHLPVLPELQGPADVPRHDRPQAEPRRHRVVLDRDGDPHLDAARLQRDPGPLPPARPRPQRAVRRRRCRGSGSPGSCSRSGSTSSR